MKRFIVSACIVLAIILMMTVRDSKAERFLNVAIAQIVCNYDPDFSKRIQNNLEKVTRIGKTIKTLKNADLIVFPEVCIQGPEPPANFTKMAEPIPDGPTTQALMKLAKDLKVWLIPGTLFEKGDDGKVYNTLVVISPEGKFVTKYRKLFPIRPYEMTEPGSEFVVFDIPGKGRIGVVISIDSMYPEVTRTLTWMGAEVIIRPAYQGDLVGGDRARIPIAQTRAQENQVWFVDANAAAPCNGLSSIIDPEGRIVEKLGDGESWVSSVLDLDMVTRVREKGSYAGGYTFLKKWAYLRKVKDFPPYAQGIENGPVFKTLSPGYVENPSQIKPY